PTLFRSSLGVGGVPAGIMHLLAHGFFKALLFLGSGSVIHGCHGEQDIGKMGALGGPIRVYFTTPPPEQWRVGGAGRKKQFSTQRCIGRSRKRPITWFWPASF